MILGLSGVAWAGAVPLAIAGLTAFIQLLPKRRAKSEVEEARGKLVMDQMDAVLTARVDEAGYYKTELASNRELTLQLHKDMAALRTANAALQTESARLATMNEVYRLRLVNAGLDVSEPSHERLS